MPASRPHIVWFRDDLRLADNPALDHAARGGAPVLGLYILNQTPVTGRPLGGASLWWLHGSLERLAEALNQHGVQLVLRRGKAREILPAIARETDASAISWNRLPGREASEQDEQIEAALGSAGIEPRTFKPNLLFAPGDVRTNSGTPFRVFTPFWRAATGLNVDRPVPAPKKIDGWGRSCAGDTLEDWDLRPTSPDWATGIADAWTPGEKDAQARLDSFAERILDEYSEGRDFPARAATSLLSPSLRFGEISVRQIWYRLQSVMGERPRSERSAQKFLAEVGWREFCHHLLESHPDLATQNFNPDFDAFPWRDDDAALEAWQHGRTGYPIVDAGMRELWTTGWMHNRVRMITASFLTKHLLVDWREGEAWFWDTLVDADPANNPAGWQWVAGCGADAAPYFRIFNPVLQGEKFDPDGVYVRHWVPELDGLDTRWLHKPWEAPDRALKAAGITLGSTYPKPIVDHKAARQRALAAYETVKKSAS